MLIATALLFEMSFNGFLILLLILALTELIP